MTKAWTGKPPSNPSPELLRLDSSANQKAIEPASAQTAVVRIKHPDDSSLKVRWEIRAEAAELTGPPPAIIPGSIREAGGRNVSFVAPDKPGPYRLFVYVYDGIGGAATANMPFLVSTTVAAK